MAERANRTQVEMARCLMLQAELPKSLWAEAVNAATFLRDRCPTKSLENKTPYEVWFGEKPYVGFLRVIRSKVIALNKNGRNKKFDSKGLEYVLVGYSHESKAYRLWRRARRQSLRQGTSECLKGLMKRSRLAMSSRTPIKETTTRRMKIKIPTTTTMTFKTKKEINKKTKDRTRTKIPSDVVQVDQRLFELESRDDQKNLRDTKSYVRRKYRTGRSNDSQKSS